MEAAAIAHYMACVNGWVSIKDICLNTGLSYKTVYYHLNDGRLFDAVLKDLSSEPQLYKLVNARGV